MGYSGDNPRLRSSLPLIFCLLFLLAAILFIFRLGERGLWGSEDRWAEVVRQMFLTRDFFHPRINGQPYFDKPLFTYWVIAVLVPVFGKLNEFVVRLPSALSGLFTLGSVAYLGVKLWNRRVAILAVIFAMTSWGLVFWSRTAAADMENVAAIMAAVCWYFHVRDRAEFCSYLIFYLICALGAQFKGLTAIAVPILVVMIDILVQGTWRRHMNLGHLFGIIPGMVVYVLPFIYASYTGRGYGEEGLYLVFRENVLRFFHAFDHREPFYVYLYYVPFLILPWVPTFLGFVVDRIKGFRHLSSQDRWILLVVVGIFLLFTASSSRRSYYILPIVPFIALGMASYLLYPRVQRWAGFWLGCQWGIIVLVGLVGISSPLIWPLVQAKTGFVPPAGLKESVFFSGIFSLALSLSGLFLFMRYRDLTGRFLSLIMLGLGGYAVLLGYFGFGQVALEAYRPQRSFLMELKGAVSKLPPDHVAISKNMAFVSFYLDRKADIISLDDASALERFLKEGGERILIARKRDMARLMRHLKGCNMELLLRAPEYSWSRRRGKSLEAWRISGPCTASETNKP